MFQLARRRLAAYLRPRRIPVWYHPSYRLPLSSLEGGAGIEPRRADLVIWYLLGRRVLRRAMVHKPGRASYADLALVHDRAYLESLSDPNTLGRIFAVDPSDVPIDEVMATVRLAAAGTLEAARAALASGGPALNLLGGFHHAMRRRGSGMCPVNDVALAVARLRREGFEGRIVVLDFDAHPPDGTADCLQDDSDVWIGSLSGCAWGALPRVDETVLDGAGDRTYLDALGDLLRRMPRPRLAFVLAGGDVLAGDRLGRLRLTLDGARRRDLLVLEALEGAASVWLPGGGYHPNAWRVLAGTGLALARASRQPIPPDCDPMSERFASIAARLDRDLLRGEPHARPRRRGRGLQLDLSADDLALGLGVRRAPRLLGHYSPEGVEYALERYGVLEHLRRLGYRHLRVALADATAGEALQVHGWADGREHLLIECVMDVQHLSSLRVLYVNWLHLRHPVARFSPLRPRLPGQVVPGLGLAREVGELLGRIAERLGLDGVAFCPAYYHTAYAARHRLRFVDPARQGRFEALVRDLGAVPLLEVTRAIAEGRVLLGGEPYAWEANEMVLLLGRELDDAEAVATERERVRFTMT